jgi:hypothetical protein
MDPSFAYTVADLARDESVALRCDCRVRTYSRAELAALVGRDARLHLVWGCGGRCGAATAASRRSPARSHRRSRADRSEPGVHRSRPRAMLARGSLRPLEAAPWN